MPDPGEAGDEPWRIPLRETRFVPMQARSGDYALFFRKAAVEITFEGDTYLVIPQSAILAGSTSGSVRAKAIAASKSLS